MLITTYLQLPKFRRYVPDWITAGVTLAYFFLVAEDARPFSRQFLLSDPTLQHPFTTSERVTGHMCLWLASLVPSAVMIVVTLFRHRKYKHHAWHILQVSLLGLALTISVDGVVTDILKCWIGRPRPDFLERCGPREGTPLDVFVDISVCTAPLGEHILADGMRLTPSGHLSISFSAFLFLSMWLYGQLRLLRPGVPIHVYMFAWLPLLLAAYVAFLRTQDYRHHFVDIVLGGIIGCLIGSGFYNRYFQSIAAENLDETRDEIEEKLPL